MMRTLSVHELTFAPGTTLPSAIEQTARAGIRAVGFSAGKMAGVGLEATKTLLRDAGVVVSGYTGLGFVTLADDLTALANDGKRRVEEGAELGADFMLVKTGPRGSMSLTEAQKYFVEGISPIAEFARACKVDLALEPSHPIFAFFSFVYTLRDALTLAREVEGMGIILDTFHSWWDPRIFEDIGMHTDAIYNVQLSDYGKTEEPVQLSTGGGRFPLGEGLIPMAEILYALDDAGYSRNYDLEIIGEFTEERRRTLLGDSKTYFDGLWDKK